jgi:hypothetical protein
LNNKNKKGTPFGNAFYKICGAYVYLIADAFFASLLFKLAALFL